MGDSQIKAIFFDVSDVLGIESFTLGIREYERLNNIPSGELYAAIHDHSHWKDFSLGKINEQEYFQSVQDNFSGPLDIVALKSLILPGLTPNKDLIALLKTLAGSYILGIVSNNPREWFEDFYNSNKLAGIFKVKAVSGYLGVRKPDRAIFEQALKMAGVEPAQAVYVDDRKEMTGEAAGLGIHIIVYQGMADFKTQLKLLKII